MIFRLYCHQFMLHRNHLQRYISDTSNVGKSLNADDISKDIFQAIIPDIPPPFHGFIVDLQILWPFLGHQTTADERAIAAKAY